MASFAINMAKPTLGKCIPFPLIEVRLASLKEPSLANEIGSSALGNDREFNSNKTKFLGIHHEIYEMINWP